MFVCVRARVWCDRPPAISESTPKPKCEDITNSYQDTLLDFVSKHFDLHCLRQCKTQSSEHNFIIRSCMLSRRIFASGVKQGLATSKRAQTHKTPRPHRHVLSSRSARPGHAAFQIDTTHCQTSARNKLFQHRKSLRMFQTEPPTVKFHLVLRKPIHVHHRGNLRMFETDPPYCRIPSRASKTNTWASLNSGGFPFLFIDPSGFRVL